jgi:uncharacterized coiled-coil DUF342 family protein
LIVLREIRDESKKTNARLDETNQRVTELNGRVNEANERLEGLREALSRQIAESEVRTTTAITSLAGSVGEVVTMLKQDRDLRPRVEHCEKDIASLKERLPAA